MFAAPRSLFAHLVLAQIAYGGLLALGFLAVLEMTHTQYHLEATQRQSLGWAGEMLSRYRGRFAPAERRADIASLQGFLQELGHASPATDFHLVDGRGNILVSSVPASRLKRASVDVDALESLILNPQVLPVTIDDPSDPGVARVFSAARVGGKGAPAGSLVLVLRGQDAGTFLSGRGSHVFRESVVMMAGISVLAFGAAVIILLVILRPIRKLSRTMELFRRESGIAWPGEDGTGFEPKGTELERLSRNFSDMARQIVDLLRRLNDDDRKMRGMFANISHDLRTPLTIILGNLESLQIRGDSLPAEQRGRLMGAAVAQARSLGRLIEAVFELSKLQSPDYRPDCEPFSIAEAVQDIAMKFSPKATKWGIAIKIVGGERHIHVLADVLLVERVLDNLIDNAIKHADGATEIRIALRDAPREVQISVADDGRGLPPQVREHLFRNVPPAPGYAGATDKGHGLGLCIVRRILELHGSRLTLVRTGMSGTELCFGLPKAAAD